MKVILFGATGMVGQGVLKECLKDPDVAQVLVVGRSPLGLSGPKLIEILHPDFTDFSPLESRFAGFDACFFCLGVSSVGMSEKDYAHITYDLTLAAGKSLAKANPQMVFIYVSGEGTDSTEKGKSMWARVKGKTENDLMKLFPATAYGFRPGGIEPMDGIRPKVRWIRNLYWVLAPLIPLLRKLFPGQITTTRRVGRAMIRVARERPSQTIWVTRDINRLGKEADSN
jgi:uncharacterized protein YbjT (DUF2867 family)